MTRNTFTGTEKLAETNFTELNGAERSKRQSIAIHTDQLPYPALASGTPTGSNRVEAIRARVNGNYVPPR